MDGIEGAACLGCHQLSSLTLLSLCPSMTQEGSEIDSIRLDLGAAVQSGSALRLCVRAYQSLPPTDMDENTASGAFSLVQRSCARDPQRQVSGSPAG